MVPGPPSVAVIRFRGFLLLPSPLVRLGFSVFRITECGPNDTGRQPESGSAERVETKLIQTYRHRPWTLDVFVQRKIQTKTSGWGGEVALTKVDSYKPIFYQKTYLLLSAF